jgi:uncharacterized protein (DUF2237 family)
VRNAAIRWSWLLVLAGCEARSSGPAPNLEERTLSNESEPGPQKPRNVLGGTLAPCSVDPMTGWYRDGSCRTDEMDRGLHVVCAQVDERFLAFTRSRGNDLSTPRPEHRFPGLKPGDRWCLCARRWLEAHEANAAPPVVLEATHEKALSVVPLEVLIPYGNPN